MSEELKPCPCCGSDEIAEGYDTEGNSAFTCEGCGLGTAWEPTAISRAAWNRRAPMSASAPAGEEGEKVRSLAKQVLSETPDKWPTRSEIALIARALLSSPRVEGELRGLISEMLEYRVVDESWEARAIAALATERSKPPEHTHRRRTNE